MSPSSGATISALRLPQRGRRPQVAARRVRRGQPVAGAGRDRHRGAGRLRFAHPVPGQRHADLRADLRRLLPRLPGHRKHRAHRVRQGRRLGAVRQRRGGRLGQSDHPWRGRRQRQHGRRHPGQSCQRQGLSVDSATRRASAVLSPPARSTAAGAICTCPRWTVPCTAARATMAIRPATIARAARVCLPGYRDTRPGCRPCWSGTKRDPLASYGPIFNARLTLRESLAALEAGLSREVGEGASSLRASTRLPPPSAATIRTRVRAGVGVAGRLHQRVGPVEPPAGRRGALRQLRRFRSPRAGWRRGQAYRLYPPGRRPAWAWNAQACTASTGATATGSGPCSRKTRFASAPASSRWARALTATTVFPTA